jgi:hypothetical protein
MSRTPDAVRRLVLDLVRPQVEAGRCSSCDGPPGGCEVDLGSVDPDLIEVAATCTGCGGDTVLRLRPVTGGGAASLR